MSVPDDLSFPDALARARAVLGGARSAGAVSAEQVPREAIGSAGENRVRAVASDGRLASIFLDHRTMRLPADDVREHLTTAINGALEQLRWSTEQPDGTVVEVTALAERLREVQDYGLRTMGLISQSIAGAIGQVGQRTGMRGDPSPRGLADLLSQSLETLEWLPGAGAEAGREEGPLRGDGASADGLVRAVAQAGGRVDLELDARAMRSSAAELAGFVVDAVNLALADLRAIEAESPQPSTIDTAELAERVRHVQDLSVAQMTGYTQALRSIMASIQSPPGGAAR
jgi:hypothetical protein